MVYKKVSRYQGVTQETSYDGLKQYEAVTTLLLENILMAWVTEEFLNY